MAQRPVNEDPPSEEESSDEEGLPVMGRMTIKRDSNLMCELMTGDEPGLVIQGEKVKQLEPGHFQFKPATDRPTFPPRK